MSANEVYTLHHGSTPLLISMPHVGTAIPGELRTRLVERALAVEDTDWHLERVYGFARELGAGMLVARNSRYVIDLNRPPENTPLYSGVNTTELVPTRFFSGHALYRSGCEPDDVEVAERLELYWRPYHTALGAELARIKAQHGYALLWEAHSIMSRVPWLFDGTLPDFNLGTAGGTSCAGTLRDALAAVLAGPHGFSHVVDGRFKGGYITRQYGKPSLGVHAVQLEMCCSTYMPEQPPWEIEPARLERLQPVLGRLLGTVLGWTPRG